MCIKRKVNISCLDVRLGICLLLAFVPQLLFAQEDSVRFIRDSIQIQPEFNESLFSPFELPSGNFAPSSMFHPEHSYSLPDFSLKESLRLPYQTNPSLLFRGDYSTGGVLHQFDRGALFGSGSQTSMAGIGRFNSASLGYQHIFNEQFELQVRANALKLNMSHITGQAFSTSGAFLYHPSDHVTFKVFGSYDIGNSYGMSTHSYCLLYTSPSPRDRG